MRTRTLLVTVSLVTAQSLAAQTPVSGPVERLREMLPVPVAERVLQRVAEARSQGLAADALLQRALELAAKGVGPENIPGEIEGRSETMLRAREALLQGGRPAAGADEIDAGATALAEGVDAAEVSALARSAPSGRSLAVPLFVIASLVDRGLPADDALARVQARLEARATDRELDAVAGRPDSPTPPGLARLGRDLPPGHDPLRAGRPFGIPPRAGHAVHPEPARPSHPTGRP
jgi:hypothetical protein